MPVASGQVVRAVGTLALVSSVLAGCQENSVGRFNARPTPTIVSHSSGSTLLEGRPVTFNGSVTDPDDPAEDLIVSWWVGEREVCPRQPAATDGTTSCVIVPELGDVEVRLQVSDPENAIDNATIEIVVTGTEAPAITLDEPLAGGSYYVNVDVVFDATVVDDHDDPDEIEVQWTSDLDGELALPELDEGGRTAGALALGEGEHTITLTATNLAGQAASEAVTITVRPANSAPACGIVAPAHEADLVWGEALALSGTATDADVDHDRLQASWSSDVDGALGAASVDSDDTITLDGQALSEGVHVLTLQVVDEVGFACTDEVTVRVHPAPTVAITAPAADSVHRFGQPLSLEAQAALRFFDVDGLTTTWSSDVDGALGTAPADATGHATLSTSSLTSGVHTITVEIQDPITQTAMDTVSLRINVIPTAPQVSLSPSPQATSGQALEAHIDVAGTDPDGDDAQLTYVYRWYRNNQLYGAASGATLLADHTERQDTWRVEVAAADAWDEGPAAASNSVDIVNAPPVIEGVVITPDPVYTRTNLHCAATVTDADGDAPAVSYEWYRNGDHFIGQGDTLAMHHFDRDDTLLCRVRAYDGTYADPEGEATITISNSPPTVEVLTIGPQPLRTNRVVYATVGTDDADDDEVEVAYAWFVNGFPSGTGGSSLNTNRFVRGDSVHVRATPTDGDEGPPVTSDAAVVLNAPPELLSVRLLPDPAGRNEDLRCVTEGFDADGDTTRVHYTWAVDGDPEWRTGYGEDTLPSTDFDVDTTVRCTAYLIDEPPPGQPAEAYVAETSETSFFEVTIQPRPPVVTQVAITPTDPGSNDPLTCTYSANDPDDGTIVETDYLWTIRDGAGVEVDTQEGGATLSAHRFGRGFEVVCAVRVRNDQELWSEWRERTVSIGNAPPIVTSIVFDPVQPYTDTDLTCVATYEDADEEIAGLAYTFYVDGEPEQTGVSATLASGAFSRGQEVTCEVVADDGRDPSAPYAQSVTIGNRAPTITGVQIAPVDPAVDDPLVASVDGYDDLDDDDPHPSGHVHQWQRWSEGAEDWVNMGGEGDTLSPTFFGLYDAVRVVVRPRDEHGAVGEPVVSEAVWVKDDVFVQQTATGAYHTCVIRSDDSLWCWGRNNRGQLGLGDTVERRVPVRVGDAGWSWVSAGDEHTCGIQMDGTLWCWGRQLYGRLGNGATGDGTLSSPAQVASDTDWTMVSAGFQHSCGVRATDQGGAGYCWGMNERARLGNTGSATGIHATPSSVSGSHSWTAIHAGSVHSCGLRDDGQVRCWGATQSGRVGNGTLGGSLTYSLGPTQLSAPYRDYTWVGLALANDHTCAVRANGEVWCWGVGSSGRLGNGDEDDRAVPTQIHASAGTSWANVSAGYGHTCATKESGEAWCWGEDSLGRLGRYTTHDDQHIPVRIGDPSGWTALSAGADHTCGVRRYGVLECWGYDRFGSVGVGSAFQRGAPVQVEGEGWAEVRAGLSHTCGVRDDDSAACWGDGSSGQIGDGATSWRSWPAEVDGAWWGVGGGELFTCGTDHEDGLWCWGGNDRGQLGLGAGLGGSEPLPTPLAGTDWVDFDAGVYHACAIREEVADERRLSCWGEGGNYQLGDGSTEDADAPVEVVVDPNAGDPIHATDWVQVAVGRDHTCGLRAGGRLWCWGYGANGALGNGDTQARPVPVEVDDEPVTGASWTLVAAGDRHTCGIRDDTSLWCWGQAAHGRLGDAQGSTDRPRPVRAGDATATWALVAGGGRHTCGIRADGTLWCWGRGAEGQCGDGVELTECFSQVQVTAHADWLDVTAGADHACAVRDAGGLGELWCWGYDEHGQLGTRTAPYQTLPRRVSGL